MPKKPKKTQGILSRLVCGNPERVIKTTDINEKQYQLYGNGSNLF